MTNRQAMVPKQPEAAQLQEDLVLGKQGPFMRQEGNQECGFTDAHQHAGHSQGLTDAGDGICSEAAPS